MSFGFHHLAIRAESVTTLAQFYREVLQLTEVRRFEDEQGIRSIWLSLGEGILMIERKDSEPVSKESEPGLYLFAFQIEPTHAVFWQEQLKHAGCPITHETSYTLYFSDPEGNRLGLSSYPEALSNAHEMIS